MDKVLIHFLLPLFFLLHELEEILMVCPWLKKNSAAMRRRFPKAGRIIRKMEQMTTLKFIVIATEEFLIVSVCTLVSLLIGNPVAWYCCLAAFGFHLIVHIIQFIAWRGYIPAIVSTAFCLPYCVWTIHDPYWLISPRELFFYTILGILLGGLNLIGMHKFVECMVH